MQTMRWLAPVCAAAALQAAAAHAAPASGETVVVTATRIPGSKDANDPSVTVIDAGEIAARHPASVVDLLRTLPGVQVQQAGGRGSVVSLFVRGAKPNFTLVLIDGVRVNDPTNTRGGSFDVSTLALDDIARVELVRGPASAIYGSDAVGGVVNFITRKPARDVAADFAASAGTYGFSELSAHIDGGLFGVALRGGISSTNNGTPVDGSLLHQTTLDGALAATPLDALSLSATARYSISRAGSFPDSSGGPLLAVLRTTDRRTVNEAVAGLHLLYDGGDMWSVALDDGLYDRAAKALSPGVAPSVQTPTGIPANGDDVDFVRNQATVTARLAPGGGLRLAFGADVLIEHGDDDGTLDFGPFTLPTHFALSRTTWAGFAQADYAPLTGLALSGSARIDDTAGAGAHFSPQLGAGYAIAATGTRLSVDWGRAFKLPSFYALGNPIVGDPTLRPERAQSLSAGLVQPFGGGNAIKLDLYDTHYNDLIDFQPGAVPKLVNLSRVHVRGGELSAELRFGDDLTFTPALSYNDARNVQSGAALRDVPHWLASGTAAWTPIAELTLSATVVHVGALIDNAIPTGDVRLGAHQRVDLAASWRATGRWTVFAAADNVFDAQYQDAAGFPAPGIVIRGGVALNL